MAQVPAAVYYVIAAVTAATATIAQGHASKQQAEAQARADENAAKVAANNALLAQRDAAQQAEQLQSERRKALAAGVVAAGASGIELSGSFGDSQFDTALSYERGLTSIKEKADMEAYNYRNQAGALMASASNARASGKAAWRISLISGIGSLAQAGAAAKMGSASAARSAAAGYGSMAESWSKTRTPATFDYRISTNKRLY